MKNLLKVALSLFIMTGVMFAETLSQSGEKDGYAVKFTSDKSLVVGSNDVFISLTQNGVVVKDAQVKIKVFMPEMPGMPYMENKAKAKLMGDTYKLNVNFAMGGTWQYQLKFRTADKKVHTLRGSVNL